MRFQIIDKAERLYFSVFDITTNRKNFPVKFRRIADVLQKISLDIYSDIVSANATRADSDAGRRARFELQTKAIADCDKLLSISKYALHAKLISFSTVERWTEMVHDVKYMLLAWRRS